MSNAKQSKVKKSAEAIASRTRRNPEKTRKAILDVAGKMMALDGPEGLSVSQIAQQAGVNRGTAYHHFQTREQLIAATMEHVSQRLHDEVFSQKEFKDRPRPRHIIENLANFAVDNPEFGPAWLHQMIRDRAAIDNDPFWQGMVSSLREFSKTEYAQPGIDVEVHALTVLTSLFTWPLWADARNKSLRQRKQLAQRYTTEALRLAGNGVARPGAFEEIDEMRAPTAAVQKKAKAPRKASVKTKAAPAGQSKSKTKAKAPAASRRKNG